MLRALKFRVTVFIQQFSISCSSIVSDSDISVSLGRLDTHDYFTIGPMENAMRAVPSQGTFSMSFPWESHSHGQASGLPINYFTAWTAEDVSSHA